MARNESQKQLLSLIRDFTAEKSQGERRVVNMKNRIEELRSELEAWNLKIVEAKREKEGTEQELKGYEVELSMNEASIQALEARIVHTNNEISTFGSELVALKSEENASRDRFLGEMLALNSEIRQRKFQEYLVYTCNADKYSEATSDTGVQKVKEILFDAEQTEEQYKAELVIHDQLQEELINLERKTLLMESVMKESMKLQELSQQTSELEEKFAVLVDQLPSRILCPGCHQDNMKELDGMLHN